MSKYDFLNRKWNVIISLVQGIPTFTFAVYAIFSNIAGSRGGMIAISVVGSLFCLILELHSSARFSAQCKEGEKPRPNSIGRILLIIHNLAFWFFLIPLFSPMSYRTGFIAFTSILFFRFLANSYINIRDFNTKQYYHYPFRIP